MDGLARYLYLFICPGIALMLVGGGLWWLYLVKRSSRRRQ